MEYAAHGNSAVLIIRMILNQDRHDHERILKFDPQVDFHLVTFIEVLEYFALYIHNANSNTE